jgi:hypothetical protein
MVSKEFCIHTRDAVHGIFDIAQEQKSANSHMSSAAMINDAFDRSVVQHAKLQEQNARIVGCGIKFIVDSDSVRETCDTVNCPFYPNGPGSV